VDRLGLLETSAALHRRLRPAGLRRGRRRGEAGRDEERAPAVHNASKMQTAAAVAMLAVLAAPTALAQGEETPTILERVRAKAEKNPQLYKTYTELPSALEKVKFMAGTWDLTNRIFKTAKSPERTEKATRVASFELEGRWLVNRDAYPDRKGIQIFGYDPLQRQWMFTYFSSEGRGTNAPLRSAAGWDGDRLILSGMYYVAGETARVNVRLSKISDDEYVEVLEEMVTANLARPVMELHAVRKK
jgi:hypothetical protein